MTTPRDAIHKELWCPICKDLVDTVEVTTAATNASTTIRVGCHDETVTQVITYEQAASLGVQHGNALKGLAYLLQIAIDNMWSPKGRETYQKWSAVRTHRKGKATF